MTCPHGNTGLPFCDECRALYTPKEPSFEQEDQYIIDMVEGSAGHWSVDPTLCKGLELCFRREDDGKLLYISYSFEDEEDLGGACDATP